MIYHIFVDNNLLYHHFVEHNQDTVKLITIIRLKKQQSALSLNFEAF